MIFHSWRSDTVLVLWVDPHGKHLPDWCSLAAERTHSCVWSFVSVFNLTKKQVQVTAYFVVSPPGERSCLVGRRISRWSWRLDHRGEVERLQWWPYLGEGSFHSLEPLKSLSAYCHLRSWQNINTAGILNFISHLFFLTHKVLFENLTVNKSMALKLKWLSLAFRAQNREVYVDLESGLCGLKTVKKMYVKPMWITKS